MSEQATQTCLVCGANLGYSVTALVRQYCDTCKPTECPECGCGTIRRARRAHSGEGVWECDNGCFFEVTADG